MIALVILAAVLCTLAVAAFFVALFLSFDDKEVHTGVLLLYMVLGFASGATSCGAVEDYYHAAKASEDAAVIQSMPRHAEKP